MAVVPLLAIVNSATVFWAATYNTVIAAAALHLATASAAHCLALSAAYCDRDDHHHHRHRDDHHHRDDWQMLMKQTEWWPQT